MEKSTQISAEPRVQRPGSRLLHDSERLANWSSSDWIDDFEGRLRAGQLQQIDGQFPPVEHAEFAMIASEMLRVAVEYYWERGDQAFFERTIAEMPWLLSHPKVLGPFAFEDYRLRCASSADAHGLTACGSAGCELDKYQQLGIDTTAWGNFFPTATEREYLLHPTASPTDVSFGDTVEPWRDGSSHPDSLRQGSFEQSGRSSGSFGFGSWNAAGLLGPSGRSSRGKAAPRFPCEGEQLGDFKLIREIGAGTFSRVFIARQCSLASRPIVLKVATTPLGESQRLARLQHANIVPLYFAESVAGFYLLGMPLLGVVTLKDIFDVHHQLEYARKNDSRSTAAIHSQNSEVSARAEAADRQRGLISQLITHRMNELQSDVPELKDMRGSPSEDMQLPPLPLDEYSEKTWPGVVLAITARTLDGLQFAHQRGLQHRDIKPANILMGFDGQPLLLDFNLSRERVADPTTQSISGTLPYMAPEQLTPGSATSGDPRQADIYSVGVVLYEALTGRHPHDLSQCPHGDLETAAVLKRCQIVPPMQLLPGLSPAINGLVMKCLQYDSQQRYLQASDLAADIRLHLSDRPLRYGPNPSWLERVHKSWRRNRRLFSIGSAMSLGVVLLVVVGLLAALHYRREGLSEARERHQSFLAAAMQAEASLFFADGGAREPGRLLAQSALELYGADLQGQPQPQRLRWLEPHQRSEVEQMIEYLQQLLQAAGSVDSETFASLQSSDLVVLATQAYFARRFEDALKLLEQQLSDAPQRFVVWFLKGRAHSELREYRQAKHCFVMATTLEPQSAISWVARGICDYQLGQFAEALTSYERAIACDSRCFAAHYNQALTYERQRDFPRALAALAAAQDIQTDSARVRMARSRIARASGNLELADSELQQLVASEPTEPEGWVLRGLARIAKEPQAALDDFAMAAKWPTLKFVAGQNRAHVLSEILQQPQAAIEVLTELLEADPDFLPALGGRAVLHARGGNRTAALADVQRCLRLDLTPQLHYQIACVYALLASQQPELAKSALHHLAVATEPAYGGQLIAADRDLLNLRGNPEFRAIQTGLEMANKARQTATPAPPLPGS